MSGENTQQTKGQQIVRLSFNPSQASEVDTLKYSFASIIDAVEGMKEKDPRLAAITQTKLEEACMFAVKLATT